MRRLEDEGIVERNSLSIVDFALPASPGIKVEGMLHCRLGVEMRVSETSRVRYRRGRAEVMGARYTYHAWFGATGRSIIRYDNTHDPADLHCHLFDVAAQEETILSVPWDALPTLEGFVRIADGIARDAQ